MRIFQYIRFQVILFIFFGIAPFSNSCAQDASQTTVSQQFTTAYITPKLFRDSTRAIEFEKIRTPEMSARFWQAESPYLTFGADLNAWWLQFTIVNELKTPKTLVLWLNRKNFDEFRLWQMRPDSSLAPESVVGAKQYNDARFATHYWILCRHYADAG